MSAMTRFLFGVGIALVLLACSVDAHGWMSFPKPRGQYLPSPKPAHDEYAPATRDPDDMAIVCRNDPVMPKANWLPLQAGKSQSITLQFNALHVGDCFVYLTYDGDKPVNEMKWFKIWEQHECKNNNNYEIAIPSYLPSGDHVIFRWEWYALHVYPTVEYYSQCVDATMSGSASGSLPQPQVHMPGHLPHLSGSPSDNTNNYWWPWDTQSMKFTGPALATLNGQPAPTNPTSAPTQKPTNAPSTSAPTQKPTTAPTKGPAPTTAPTQRPAPTTAPTNAPRPTTPPVVAPAQSVKLAVLPGSGIWWLAIQVTGHRSDEVKRVHIKDSGNFGEFTQMTNEWGDVYFLNAGEQGPITFPVTVKASLSSGSSLSFFVNGPSATTVDSGTVFP
jgi:hypothetical protein